MLDDKNPKIIYQNTYAYAISKNNHANKVSAKCCVSSRRSN